MLLDLSNFTPLSSFVGGVIIGIATIFFFSTTGRIAGISGILSNALQKKENNLSNLLFLIGLILGPALYLIMTMNEIPFLIQSSIPLMIVGGLLVGIGTKTGSGCTSGHGICGISLFSSRSIVATIIFMFTAIISVFILKLLGVT